MAKIFGLKKKVLFKIDTVKKTKKPNEEKSKGKKKLDGECYDRVMKLNTYLKAVLPIWDEKKPLKVGFIHELFDFVEGRGLKCSRRTMRFAIAWHTKCPSYMSKLSRGGDRYNINNEIDGVVSERQMDEAIERYEVISKALKKRKVEKKKKNNRLSLNIKHK